ncbi:MAG: DNA recombination/repair protein RecA, partial [Atribacterota bacterium]
GQGKENTKIFLSEKPELAREIEKKILEAAHLPTLENNPNEQELPNN